MQYFTVQLVHSRVDRYKQPSSTISIYIYINLLYSRLIIFVITSNHMLTNLNTKESGYKDTIHYNMSATGIQEDMAGKALLYFLVNNSQRPWRCILGMVCISHCAEVTAPLVLCLQVFLNRNLHLVMARTNQKYCFYTYQLTSFMYWCRLMKAFSPQNLIYD